MEPASNPSPGNIPEPVDKPMAEEKPDEANVEEPRVTPQHVGRPKSPRPKPMSREQHLILFAGIGLRGGPKLRVASKGGVDSMGFAMFWMDDAPATITSQAAALDQLHGALWALFGTGPGSKGAFSIFVRPSAPDHRTSLEGRDNFLVLRYGEDLDSWTPDQVFHRLARGIVRELVKLDGPEGDDRGTNVQWFNEGENFYLGDSALSCA